MTIYNHTAGDRTPYTYLIGWSIHKKYYYGIRFAKNCHPLDLWNPYKTSSKLVKSFVKEFGRPDIIQIRKIFNSVEKARYFEHKVLKRMNVIEREDFLNKTDNISILNKFPLSEIKRKEISRKISIKLKGRKMSDESKSNQSLGKMGSLWWNNGIDEKKAKVAPDETYIRGRIWKPSEEQKQKNSILHKGNKYSLGKPASEKQKMIASLTHKGRAKSPETILKMKESGKKRFI